jgi:hypothetical protein
MDDIEVIHCIGDSHASFFAGYDEIQPPYSIPSKNKYPFLRAYRLGAVLAYSLATLNTKEQGREKMLEIIGSLPARSTLLLCFGEIDCRCHLLKQSKENNRELKEVVGECVRRYFTVIDELIALKFNVMLWNAVPTSEDNNPEYPIYGTEAARNKTTLMFNEMLLTESKARGLAYISIFEKLVTKDLKTKKEFFFDSIHLGQLAMPYLFGELKKIKPELITFNDVQIQTRILRSVLKYYTIRVYRLVREFAKKKIIFSYSGVTV